jgi:predicted  nucleic acid-binding Zn-ribbon protein
MEDQKKGFSIKESAQIKMRGLGINDDMKFLQQQLKSAEDRITELHGNISAAQSNLTGEHLQKIIRHNQFLIQKIKEEEEKLKNELNKDISLSIESICPYVKESQRREFISSARQFVGLTA